MGLEETRLICTTCPMGCTLEVAHDGSTVARVTGHSCRKGIDYARAELSDPRRMVATTVRVRRGLHPLVPVCTAAPFPKGKIMELMAELRRVEIDAPVRLGQIVLANALGTGVDVVASRDMPLVDGASAGGALVAEVPECL
ncbi:MAG: DUF1667 domain-containing protein [Anaerolineae bacterium]|nr:DUF1667 domain-containing protein [Anaerolineae bacterium]